ncbi:type II toxin-antitoxin system RelE/ParE family toxin [Candidatus Thioglobus sp.]|uniref:type II toxin-antitoxin system RelE/ParE family toxin n=1 Tax=Candidatus Thioglobus sp. TaxID=2026721 RepID=UPI003D12520C
MSLKIKRTIKFSKSFKRLAKKYKSIAIDYVNLIDSLESGNHNAVEISNNIYKIRLQNSSNPKGKSGGFRVVYFFKTKANEIYLLDIFSKNETNSIHKSKLQELSEKYGLI